MHRDKSHNGPTPSTPLPGGTTVVPSVSPGAEVLCLPPGDELEQARSHLEELEVSCQAVFLFPAAELRQESFHGRGGPSRTFPCLLQGGGGSGGIGCGSGGGKI